MHFTLRKSAALLFACGALATSAVGQTEQWMAATHGSLDGLAWPPTWSAPGTFKRSRIGEFTGDARSDVVTLAGSKLVLLSDVLESGTHYELATNVIDFDVLAGGGVGGRDAVAATSSAGLSVIENIPGVPIDFGSTLIATGGWMGAVRVICGDINNGGHGDYVGLQSNQQTLLVRIAESARQLPIGSSEAVVDLALLHWGSATELALAVLTPTKVVVYDAFGPDFSTPLASFSVSGGYSMAIIPKHDGATVNSDHIAVLRQVANPPLSSTELRVFSMGGGYTSLAILPAAQCISLGAGDMDDDGKGDLIVAYPNSFVPFHLRNTGTATPLFVAPTNWSETIDVNDPTLESAYSNNNVARLAVGDVDYDGRADLVIPMQQTGLSPGQSPGHACLTYAYNDQSLTTFWNEGWLDDYAAGHLHGWICFNRGQIGTANGVALSIWRQRGQGAYLDTVPAYEGYFYIPTDLSGVIGLEVDLYYVPAACFESSPDPRQMYWVEMTPVQLEDFNDPVIVLDSFPRRLAVIASAKTDVCDYMFDPDQYAMTMLYDRTHGGTIDQTSHANYGGPVAGACAAYTPCPSGSSAATTEMPALVKRRRMPQHNPDSTPPPPPTGPAPTAAISYPHP